MTAKRLQKTIVAYHRWQAKFKHALKKTHKLYQKIRELEKQIGEGKSK